MHNMLYLILLIGASKCIQSFIVINNIIPARFLQTSRLSSNEENNIVNDNPTQIPKDKVAANIAAVGTIQSGNVFKLVKDLEDITNAYEATLTEMEKLRKEALEKINKIKEEKAKTNVTKNDLS